MNPVAPSLACLALAVGVQESTQESAPAPEQAEAPWSGRLQLRGGSVGGNPVVLNLSGTICTYGDELAAGPLSFDEPIDAREPFRGWCAGADIPKGRTLVLRHVRWEGANLGDGNGDGDFEVWLGRERIAHQGSSPEPIQGQWSGEVRVPHGFAHAVSLTASNSSWGDVRLEGVLVDDPAATWPTQEMVRAVSDAKGAPGRATLLSRARHGDYETATFSFQHGVRDDPELEVTRNDWDLQFGNGGDRFTVTMVSDDRSVIADLGQLGWDDLIRGELERPSFHDRAEAVSGHLYLVHTLDSDTDALSLFRVVELVPGDRVELEWVLVEAIELPRPN